LVISGIHAVNDGLESVKHGSSGSFEEVVGGFSGMEGAAVSDGFGPNEIEGGEVVASGIVPAVSKGIRSGGVSVEEQTVFEGLEELKSDVVPGGVDEEGLQNWTIGSTSTDEVVVVQKVVNGGESNVPFRFISLVVKLVEVIEMGEVAGVDSVGLQEVDPIAGVSLAGHGGTKGGVQGEDLREEDANGGFVGLDVSISKLVVQGDEFPVSSSTGIVVTVASSTLGQLEISPDGIVILDQLGLSSGDFGDPHGGIRLKDDLGEEGGLDKGNKNCS